MKSLVIGGTGPTGPHIIGGLLARGHAVTMLNRGSRDSGAIPAEVERIVGDPHFPDTLEASLGDRKFDLVIATYGRLRYVAEVLSTRTDRLVTVGGTPGYRGFADPEANFPPGMPVPAPEDAPRVESPEEHRFGHLVRMTEDAIMARHHAGDMTVTHFRYPVVYGPGQTRPVNFEWIMRRCRDRRPYAVLSDAGLTLMSRGYAGNMAHAVLLAVDRPEVAGGKIYNCADDLQFTLAQWVALVAGEMDWPLEIVTVPDRYASPSRDLMMFRGTSHHQLLDTFAIRHDLGYRDPVDPVEAVRRTVRWLRKNPPEPCADPEKLAAEYEIEDRLVEIYRTASAGMAALDHDDREYHHSYAHPRERGLARDHRNR